MIAAPLSPPSLRVAIGIAARDRVLYLIAAAFVALSLAWNFVTPVFEAPDEPDHLQYILFVTVEGRRPDLRTEVARAGIQSFHPPLYYFILGALLRVGNMPHSFVHPTRNPDFSFEPTSSTPNYFLPSVGSYDYVHFLRGTSVVFGLVTVICTFLAGVLLGTDRMLRLAATAMTAFLPQFTFMSGAINNDNLGVALGSLGFVWLVYILQLSKPRNWQIGVLGVICAVAFLTKLHVAILLVSFSLVMFVLHQGANWKRLLNESIALALGFLLVGGWYVVYNQWHYGDPYAFKLSEQILPEGVTRRSWSDPYDIAYFTVFLPRLLFQSFLGTFGWMKIFLLPIWYILYGLLWLGALTGITNALVKRRWGLAREALIIAPLLLLVFVLCTNLVSYVNQGRLLFPALVAISLVFVLGLAELPRPWCRVSLLAAPWVLLFANVYSLWLVHSVFAS